MQIGDVVQFNEKHKWCGCLGIIIDTRIVKTQDPLVQDVRYMVGVPVPQQGTAYIYELLSENTIEYVGKALLTIKEDE